VADDKGIIVVPKPGELLGLLGASGLIADAVRDYARTAVKRDMYFNRPPPATIDFEWLGHDALERQERDHEAFKKEYLGKFLTEPPINVPVVAGQESETAEDKFFGVDWGAEAVPGGITKQNLKDALATLAAQALKAEPLLGPQSMWDELKKEEKSGVDIAFWYYRDTLLAYSIRRVADNFFYDFATKKFSMLPVSPRAGMPKAEPTKPSGCIYSTRLSGKLDDGEYVVTIRDSQADDVVVGITALFMQGGTQTQTPPQGLENTPIEEGIPAPAGTFRRAERRIRTVDTDGPA
jgi:hypothetical protein